MWKLLKILGHLVRALFFASLLLACLAIGLLYILEHGLPKTVINKLEAKISSEDIIVDIGRITFNFESGLHLHEIKVYPRKLPFESFGTIEDVVIKFSLTPGIGLSERLQSITLKKVNSPHHPRKILRQLKKLHPEKKKKDKPPTEIPSLAPFQLIIEDSHVIGFKTKKTTATLELNDKVASFTDIHLEWADSPREMGLKGRLYLYFDTEMLDGFASGEAFPENITGFLQELEVHTVLREIDHFSELKEPINVDCGFKVELKNNDFALDIDLDVGACAYREVPLKYAKGNIKAYGTNNTTWVDIQGLRTESSDGKMEGSLYYDESDESMKVDALSTMRHKDVTTIIDILTHGELEPVLCENPPVVTAIGIVAMATNAPVQHNITGKIKTGTASIFGLKVQQASSDYSIKGNEAILQNIDATTPSGGMVNGSAVFSINMFDDSPPSIVSQANFNKIDLSDLAHIFSITNDKVGECSGHLELSGILGTNQLQTLNGQGDFKVIKGRINQLRLFAGLTDYLSRNIPGISSLVDQSSCSLQFTIKDGILSTDNFDIQGDIFSIDGKGTYDMPKDYIDLTVHVALFRKETIAGKIARIITFPFKKLLLEFKVYGSTEDPQWSYVTILEKIVDQIPGTSQGKEKEENNTE